MLVVFHHNVQIFIRCYNPRVLPVRIAYIQLIVVSVPGFRILYIAQRIGIGRGITIIKCICI